MAARSQLPSPDEALPGRHHPILGPYRHFLKGTPLQPPFPDHLSSLCVGMGCFWGVERLFWQIPGVWSTAAGYAGGYTPNPTYEEVCSGLTGHAEVVQIIFDPQEVRLERLLQLFWENHDPTQVMRQGNDIGTQYRSALYTPADQQLPILENSRNAYQKALLATGLGEIQTEIRVVQDFFPAEAEHQQYLAKNPWGYCNLQGTGICLPPA